MSKSSHFPHTIEKALKTLDQRLPSAVAALVFDDEKRQRGLRSDKDRSLRLVLRELVKHLDGASGFSCFLETQTTARPLCVRHIVKETGLARRTVEYALRFLRDHGLIEIERQVIKSAPSRNGLRLAVSDCYRSITGKLWAMLGLLAEIRDLAAYKQNERLQYAHNVTALFVDGPCTGSRRTFKDAPPASPPPERRQEKTDFAALLKARTGIDLGSLAKS